MMSNSEWWNTEMKITQTGEISQVSQLVLWLVLLFENGQGKKNSQKIIRNWLSREKMYKEEGYRNDWNASKFFGKFFFSQVDDIDIF
jgi:hypothetical protein